MRGRNVKWNRSRRQQLVPQLMRVSPRAKLTPFCCCVSMPDGHTSPTAALRESLHAKLLSVMEPHLPLWKRAIFLMIPFFCCLGFMELVLRLLGYRPPPSNSSGVSITEYF